MSGPRIIEKFASVDSRRIRYVSSGSGPAVILIHSLGGSLDWWDLTIPALSEHFSVYALDLPGAGMSDSLNEDVSPHFAALFMGKFMETVRIDKASLFGHSMGGYIALQTAIDFPTKVGSLVLVSSAGFGRVHHLILRLLALPVLGEIAATPTLMGTRVFIRSLVYDKKFASKERIDSAFRYFRRPGAKESFLRALRAGVGFNGCGRNLPSPEDIGRITAPTMIVWGAQDPVFPPSQARLAHSLIRSSRLHILDNCGHIPQIEQSAKFNKLASEFLLPPV